ncbi:hypothetical protein D9M68_598300 [compost metagenome]
MSIIRRPDRRIHDQTPDPQCERRQRPCARRPGARSHPRPVVRAAHRGACRRHGPCAAGLSQGVHRLVPPAGEPRARAVVVPAPAHRRHAAPRALAAAAPRHRAPEHRGAGARDPPRQARRRDLHPLPAGRAADARAQPGPHRMPRVAADHRLRPAQHVAGAGHDGLPRGHGRSRLPAARARHSARARACHGHSGDAGLFRTRCAGTRARRLRQCAGPGPCAPGAADGVGRCRRGRPAEHGRARAGAGRRHALPGHRGGRP